MQASLNSLAPGNGMLEGEEKDEGLQMLQQMSLMSQEVLQQQTCTIIRVKGGQIKYLWADFRGKRGFWAAESRPI